jgi:hypothetical protein
MQKAGEAVAARLTSAITVGVRSRRSASARWLGDPLRLVANDHAMRPLRQQKQGILNLTASLTGPGRQRLYKAGDSAADLSASSHQQLR